MVLGSGESGAAAPSGRCSALQNASRNAAESSSNDAPRGEVGGRGLGFGRFWGRGESCTDHRMSMRPIEAQRASVMQPRGARAQRGLPWVGSRSESAQTESVANGRTAQQRLHSALLESQACLRCLRFSPSRPILDPREPSLRFGTQGLHDRSRSGSDLRLRYCLISSKRGNQALGKQ